MHFEARNEKDDTEYVDPFVPGFEGLTLTPWDRENYCNYVRATRGKKGHAFFIAEDCGDFFYAFESYKGCYTVVQILSDGTISGYTHKHTPQEAMRYITEIIIQDTEHWFEE